MRLLLVEESDSQCRDVNFGEMECIPAMSVETAVAFVNRFEYRLDIAGLQTDYFGI